MENNIISCLKNFQFKYKNKEIQINLLDELIIKSIQETYNNSIQKSSLNITIDDEITIVYILIVVGIISYYKNMKDPENNILDNISEGEKVCYKREIYTFEGYEEIKEKEYIKLRNKSLLFRVPITNAYEITMYNGEATRINKKKNLIMKNNSNITKAFISNLMEVDVSQLNGGIEKSNLLIIKGKEKIIEILNSISVVFEDINIPFTELFSVAYWTSSERKILKNSLKEDTLINITTNISTGLELVSDDERIKNIIIIGGKTYKDSYENELRTLNLFCNIEKLMVFNTWEDECEYEYFLDEENEFDIRAFTKGALEEYINVENFKVNEIQKKYYTNTNILMNKEKTINFVGKSDSFNNSLKDVLNLLRELSDYSDSSDEVLHFVKTAYYLCNKLQNSIIPLKYCFENKDNILEKILFLEAKKRVFPEVRVEYKIMLQIVQKLNMVLENLNDVNEKFETIKNFVKNHQGGVLLLKNKDELSSMKRYLIMNGVKNLSYEILKKERDFSKYEYVIIPFYTNSKQLLENRSIKKMEIISYKREFYRYKNDFEKNEKIMNLICKKNILKENDKFDSGVIYANRPKLEINLEKEEEHLLIEENKIKNMLEENYIKLLTSPDFIAVNQSYQNNPIFAKKIIILNNEDCAFLTENYRVNCIERRKNDISSKDIEEIEIGDEIIFVRNINNDKTDIIKDILEKLLDEKEFKNLYGEFFEKNQLWKSVLIDYMKDNELDEREISKRLKLKGQNVNPVTIKNWLNGNIIGPRDSNNIKMIAEIINNENVIEDFDNISKACSEVRRIQIGVRKIIANMIINSVINQYENRSILDKLIIDVVGDLSNYAYIGEVTDIQKTNEKISAQYANKIIEGDRE